ncbi:M14 family metallopeptidase [Paraflavitalea pollutisoli]|uniref:M14 family metallopeptidase n=1 Tax=Paraflavitalea pollutisoli TaxID=3034143 RepID=UPI0023EBD26A|nr:M14 family metallopeptidase [Paraflavitalea sp. H1-2-19X]
MLRSISCQGLRLRQSLFILATMMMMPPVFLACNTARKTVQAAPGAVDTLIQWQVRKDYVFANGIGFSNRFAGARLNAVRQQNDSSFTITILPENEPINPSPWYAFKVWAAQQQPVYITLQYPSTKHRYDPKQSSDGLHWQDIKPVQVAAGEKQATFTAYAGPDTLLIAAQELISSADGNRWMDSIAVLPHINQQVVGKSRQGKPIRMLTSTGSDGKKLVVVLSRQHPPEVTGYMAMQEFVRTVTGPGALAQRFRQQYELVLFPLLNPDGVDEGNWRHSAGGVDLNRDWELFAQPETRAVKETVESLVRKQQANVEFMLDFHSTYYDIFYINQLTDPLASNRPGFTEAWLAAMKAAIPGFKPNIKPSGNGGNVSKGWFSRAFGAEALTYEVGDNTSREQLRLKGRVAAEEMMKLLLQ